MLLYIFRWNNDLCPLSRNDRKSALNKKPEHVRKKRNRKHWNPLTFETEFFLFLDSDKWNIGLTTSERLCSYGWRRLVEGGLYCTYGGCTVPTVWWGAGGTGMGPEASRFLLLPLLAAFCEYILYFLFLFPYCKRTGLRRTVGVGQQYLEGPAQASKTVK